MDLGSLPNACGFFEVEDGGINMIDGIEALGGSWQISKDPEKKPDPTVEVLTDVPLCAPRIPANVSPRLPGFFHWCIAGSVEVANNGSLAAGQHWGIKTHFCEVTSDNVTGAADSVRFRLEHRPGDRTVIRNSFRSTMPLWSLGLGGEAQENVHFLQPGEVGFYLANGVFRASALQRSLAGLGRILVQALGIIGFTLDSVRQKGGARVD
jgi:hypothetical protein